ncbi:MAG TPA: isoprenylcysteine carboxylmethyltransferase family protein [Terriglobales bacterium]|nr:isoprenylcysteine carboxylmethyltransferase family protein [Terriglobales bacterium]
MKNSALWQIELFPWYVFGAYWALTWLRVKRTKAMEKPADRLITLVGVGLSFILLFETWLRIGPLRLRFVPDAAWIAWAGIVLTWAGVAVAIWARYTLGQNWSARVTLKEGHELIRSGPYATMRHPIYTGMLLGTVGAALVVGELRGIMAVALLLAAHSRKALREEGMLLKEFGEKYAAYRKSTGFLFPRISGKNFSGKS